MTRSTPHPPETALENVNLGNLTLFTIKPNVRIEDALTLASEYLSCAAATAHETADNSTREFRPLAISVVKHIETARALVEASVVGLEAKRGTT